MNEQIQMLTEPPLSLAPWHLMLVFAGVVALGMLVGALCYDEGKTFGAKTELERLRNTRRQKRKRRKERQRAKHQPAA